MRRPLRLGPRIFAAPALGVGLLVALAACGPSPPSSSTVASPGPQSIGPIGPPPGGRASPTAPVAGVSVDPGLLRFVPSGGHGIDLTFDADTTSSVAGDPGLAASISSLAIGLYSRRPAGASAAPSDDLVIVNVANLRDPAADDAWFRDWRDSYDLAACANAGGVVRHAETTLGGKTFFVGSCAAGSFTYHVRLPDVGIVVSLTSIGPGRLGEEIVRLMAP